MGTGEPGRRVPRSLRHARDLSTARRIVATAEGIFADQGLAGARMDEIARAAKVNKALLYYYFRSKEELHRFVLETLLSQLSTKVGDVGADAPSPRKRLSAIVDNFFDFVLGAPKLSAADPAGDHEPRAEHGMDRVRILPPTARAAGTFDRGWNFRRRISARGCEKRCRDCRFDSRALLCGRASAAQCSRTRPVAAPRKWRSAARPFRIFSSTGCSGLAFRFDADAC